MAGDPSLLTSSLTAALSKGCSSSTSHAFPHLEASSLVAPLASNTVSPDLPQISPHSQVASSCHSTPVLSDALCPSLFGKSRGFVCTIPSCIFSM